MPLAFFSPPRTTLDRTPLAWWWWPFVVTVFVVPFCKAWPFSFNFDIPPPVAKFSKFAFHVPKFHFDRTGGGKKIDKLSLQKLHLARRRRRRSSKSIYANAESAKSQNSTTGHGNRRDEGRRVCVWFQRGSNSDLGRFVKKKKRHALYLYQLQRAD